MSETSLSLLDRARSGADADALRRLVEIYTPLVRAWLRRQAVSNHDSDDLVQEVLAVVVRRLPDFQREPHPGAFRGWLRAITANCLRNAWRAKRIAPRTIGDSRFADLIEQLADPASGLSRLWDEEHDRHVSRQLLELVRPHFEPTTWEAFRQVALANIPAEQVAAGLGVSVNAVFIAKSRVLTRLRHEARGLLADE